MEGCVAVSRSADDTGVELACAAVRLALLYAEAGRTVLDVSPEFAKQFNVPLPSVVTTSGQVVTGATAIVEYVISNISDVPTQEVLLGATPYEKGVVDQWTAFAEDQRLAFANLANLHAFNSNLEERSFVAGAHITISDLMMFPIVHSWMKEASVKEKAANIEILRWFDHMQHLRGVRNAVPTLPFIEVFPTAVRAPPQAAAASGAPCEEAAAGRPVKATGKATKKGGNESPKKGAAKSQNAPAAKRVEDDPSRLDIRVGVIKKVWHHPEADRLYCEEIDIGEASVRQIASGLREHLTMDQMLGARVCVLANLKAKNLRKFNSHGMVMCASSKDGSVCELITPPTDAKIGERVTLDALPYTGDPDAPLPAKDGNNPFAAVQPHWRTDEAKVAFYKDSRWMTSAGPCVCSTVVGGTIS